MPQLLSDLVLRNAVGHENGLQRKFDTSEIKKYAWKPDEAAVITISAN
jgi:hypothetical protein